MDSLALQTSRLVAAVPRDKSWIATALDVDDVVSRRVPGGSSGRGSLGVVIRTPKGIEDCSQDEDPGETCKVSAGRLKMRIYVFFLEQEFLARQPLCVSDDMNPEKGEVQVAWEDGTVANVKCEDLILGEEINCLIDLPLLRVLITPFRVTWIPWHLSIAVLSYFSCLCFACFFFRRSHLFGGRFCMPRRLDVVRPRARRKSNGRHCSPP